MEARDLSTYEWGAQLDPGKSKQKAFLMAGQDTNSSSNRTNTQSLLPVLRGGALAVASVINLMDTEAVRTGGLRVKEEEILKEVPNNIHFQELI